MIEVLKQMQEALREYHYYTIDAGLPNQSMLNKGYAAFQAGKQAIAELESQEPVAWRAPNWSNLHGEYGYRDFDDPVIDISNGKPSPYNEPLYTHSPQRTWVGLASEDRLTAKYMQDAPDGIEAVIDYIEAKLKELNG
jgi:hypothetical protein